LSPGDKAVGQIQMSLEYLFAGETETAIKELSAAGPMLAALHERESLHTAWLLKRFLAIAHLRLGEQQNCVAHHTSDSCLLPISRAGVHEVQEGSRAAINYLTQALTENPGDLESI